MLQNLKIIKNRSDIGAGTRGSDLGVDAMEVAAINQGFDFFQRFNHVDVPTRNEAVYNETHRYAKYIEDIFEQCLDVSETVNSVLIDKQFPLILSGDHSSAIGSISGIKKTFPEKKIGVIWIDAHADIHSPYTTPSGNMHGMSLAAVMQLDNLSYQQNFDLDNLTLDYWQKIKNIGTKEAKLSPKELIYIGLRDTEEQEDAIILNENIQVYTVQQVRSKGISLVMEEINTHFQECDLIYVSFDVDSMDSDHISNGTGTPVPNGFYQEEVKEILSALVINPKLICLEIAEVNPLLDQKGNKMAEVAVEILEGLFPRNNIL